MENWTLLSKTTKKLEALEMWFYKRMLKISWTDKVTNAEVLQRLNTQRELIPTIIKRKCQYFGHIIRNTNKYTLLTIILQGKIAGKKKPGRQKNNMATEHQKLDKYQYRTTSANSQKQRTV